MTDQGVARRVVDAACLTPKDLVVEVGPGRGALTGPLVKTGARVIAVELDAALSRDIEARYGSDRVSVLNRDVLAVDFEELLADYGPERSILIGNLPYRITGSLMERILDAHRVWKRCIVMVQREVARRITARPGRRDYGILSIAVWARCRPQPLFEVGPGCFSPSPRVYSAVVGMEFIDYQVPNIRDETLYFDVVRTVFQKRRKMLRNSLREIAGDHSSEVLTAAGIETDARPETVSPEDFERLCEALRACL